MTGKDMLPTLSGVCYANCVVSTNGVNYDDTLLCGEIYLGYWYCSLDEWVHSCFIDSPTSRQLLHKSVHVTLRKLRLLQMNTDSLTHALLVEKTRKTLYRDCKPEFLPRKRLHPWSREVSILHSLPVCVVPAVILSRGSLGFSIELCITYQVYDTI